MFEVRSRAAESDLGSGRWGYKHTRPPRSAQRGTWHISRSRALLQKCTNSDKPNGKIYGKTMMLKE